MSGIRYKFRTSVTIKGGSDVSDSYSVTPNVVEQSEVGLFKNIQPIGTVEEQLDVGNITTPGMAAFTNLDDTNYVEIGSWQPGGGLPANSKLRIDSSGEVWMESATNGLWYQVQMQGTDGSAAIAVGQTGGAAPALPGGAFYAFLKLKPGESQICRIGVSAARLYARANTAEVLLLSLIYED